MSPFEAAMLGWTAPPAMLAAWILYRSHRMAARAAVTALCLVCSHADTRKDREAAAKAGNMHGDKTGHPLVLVEGAPSSWKRDSGPAIWKRNGGPA